MIKVNKAESIKKVFLDKNSVPICFAANDGYIAQTAVMIFSIVQNAVRDKNYDIIILSTDISEHNEKNVLSIANDKKNVSIRIFDISDYVVDIDFYTNSVYTNTKYSKEAYFRLFIPALMPSYNRVIYFDGDMVAIKDVSPLMDIDLSGQFFAATRDYCGIAACYDPNSDRLEYRKSLGLKRIDDYFISSLIIFNIVEYNNSYSLDTLKKIILEREWKQHDQDILNVLSNGKCKIIDAKWSFFDEMCYTMQFLPKKLSKELIEASESPCVIHYAADKKAWIDHKSKFNKYFWEYAYKTVFFDVFNGLVSSNDVCFKYTIFHHYLQQRLNWIYLYDDILLSAGHRLIGKLSDLKVCVEFLTIKNNRVCIEGYYETVDIFSNMSLFVKMNGRRCSPNILQTDRYCAVQDAFRKVISFSFNLELEQEINEIDFELTPNNNINSITPAWVAVEQFAPINENPLSFYHKDGWTVTKANGRSIIIEKETHKRVLRRNAALCREISKRNMYFKKIALIRYVFYAWPHLLRNKEIWLLSLNEKESLTRVQEFYNFLNAKKDVCPILVADDVDGKCCRKRGMRIVRSKSIVHKVLSIFATTIIGSQYDLKYFLPCFNRSHEVRDLIANKKYVICSDDLDSVKCYIKPYYNVYKFITRNYSLAQKIIDENNGYNKKNVFLIANTPKKGNELWSELYSAIKETK